MSFCWIDYGCFWHPEELEMAKKHLGENVPFPNGDFLLQRINAESLTRREYNKALQQEEKFQNYVINPMASYIYTDAKEVCLDVWAKHRLPTPEYFVYSNREDFKRKFNFGYPMILKVNDNTGGLDTFLVDDASGLSPALEKVEEAYQRRRKQRDMFTKKMCVKFIDISIGKGRSTAFRMVVSGSKIVCTYPKIGITRLAENYATFNDEIKDVFIEQCVRAVKLKEAYEEIVIKAAHVLGLHYIGIDLIANKKDNIYLLEVQPFYNCGNPTKSYPPYWPFNPGLPENLVNWLVLEKEAIYPQISHFYDTWLDKKRHFDLVYKNLFNYFEGA